MLDLLQEFHIYQHTMAISLGMPRLFMLCMVAPFFGPAVISGQISTVLVFSLYLVVHPLVQSQIPAALPASGAEMAFMALLMGKEVLLGLIVGWLASVPFWAAQSGGFFIDNQRGASMAEMADALSGEQTSPLGILFLQALIYIFFVSGAFLTFLGLMYASYVVWPVTSFLPLPTLAATLLFADEADWIMVHMLLLAGPIAVACLLIDFALGLMNRFASQLNVYILAMPIKSGVTAFIMLVYIGKFSDTASGLFQHIHTVIRRLQGLW